MVSVDNLELINVFHSLFRERRQMGLMYFIEVSLAASVSFRIVIVMN